MIKIQITDKNLIYGRKNLNRKKSKKLLFIEMKDVLLEKNTTNFKYNNQNISTKCCWTCDGLKFNSI